VEGDDAKWTCRHGLTVFDSHAERQAAIDHLKLVSAELGLSALIFVHTMGGQVEQIE
jgi:hypothetical protein